jgi:hypothetical protein
MLLAHVSFTHEKESYTDLCLVPIEESRYVEPTRIRLLRPQASAVYHIGPREAVMVMPGDEPSSIIIEPLTPAPLYLTPDSPTQPGYRVARVKIVKKGNEFSTYFKMKDQIGAGWKEWVANKIRTE